MPNKLTFRFEYTVEKDEILFVYQSSAFTPEFVQKCRLTHQFVSSNYMKMYVSGHSHDPLRSSFAVSSFEITSTVFKPTVSPSYHPTYNPTLRPTYNPSTPRPTYNPTLIPTYNTRSPTVKPTYNATPRPSISPTLRPSIH
eukprot:253042_1